MLIRRGLGGGDGYDAVDAVESKSECSLRLRVFEQMSMVVRVNVKGARQRPPLLLTDVFSHDMLLAPPHLYTPHLSTQYTVQDGSDDPMHTAHST
jgi:hypothetical protein